MGKKNKSSWTTTIYNYSAQVWKYKLAVKQEQQQEKSQTIV